MLQPLTLQPLNVAAADVAAADVAALWNPAGARRVASGEWVAHCPVPPPTESVLDYEFRWQR